MSWPNTYPSSWPHTTQVLRDTQPNCLLLLHNCYNHHTHSHNYGHHNHHYGFTKTQPASHFVIMKSAIQRQCICICIDRRCICILRIRKATRLGNISISLTIFWPSFDRLPNPRQCRRSVPHLGNISTWLTITSMNTRLIQIHKYKHNFHEYTISVYVKHLLQGAFDQSLRRFHT